MQSRSVPVTLRKFGFGLYRFLCGTLERTILAKTPIFRRLHRKIVSRLRPEYVYAHGHKLYLDPSDAMHLSFNFRVPLALDLLDRDIRPGDHVVDVGAHIGLIALWMARGVGCNGHVYALEPDRENHRLLVRNIEANRYSNITVFQKAVSDSNRRASLHRSDCSALHRLHASPLCHETVEVDCIRLDNVFAGVDHSISIVKIDVEGSELRVLRGMARVIELNPGIRLLLEFAPCWLEEGGTPTSQLLDFLSKKGFRLFDVDEPRGCVHETTPRELQSRYTPDSGAVTNLWCVRDKEWRGFSKGGAK